MQSKILTSRRSALRAMTIAGGAASLGTILASRTAEAMYVVNKTDATALALCGDESHNSDYIRSGLGKTLVKEAGLKIDFTDEEKLVTYDNLKCYKILIMFRDGQRFPDGYKFQMYWNPGPGLMVVSDPPLPEMKWNPVAWMTKQQGKDIKRWVSEGGSLWAWHNNSHASLMNEDYHDVQGAVYAGHPRIRPFKVVITNKNHPITKGVNDFIVTDEQHYLRYDKDPKYVLARSVYEGDEDPWRDQFDRVSNTCESVWAYDYGKGRVCFMAPGHMITALWNPEYEKMQKNAVKWLLRET